MELAVAMGLTDEATAISTGAADKAVAPTVVTGSLTAAFRTAFFVGRFAAACFEAGRFVASLEEASLLLAVVFLVAFFGMSVSLHH